MLTDKEIFGMRVLIVDTNGKPVNIAESGNGGAAPVRIVDTLGIGTGDTIREFTSRITLPANQTLYSAGDVIANATIGTIANVAKAAGYGLTLTNIHVQTNDAIGLAGKNLKIHLFRESVANIADNGVFAIADANTRKRKGLVALTMGTGTLSKVGASNFENLSFCPVTRDIFFILEDVDGHTPGAVSAWIDITFTFILGN